MTTRLSIPVLKTGDGKKSDENFATGITSTYVTGNWLAERESSNSDTMGDVSVAPIPYPADGQPATYMECKPMFIMEGSENKDEAFDLATAFCSKNGRKQHLLTDPHVLMYLQIPNGVKTSQHWLTQV